MTEGDSDTRLSRKSASVRKAQPPLLIAVNNRETAAPNRCRETAAARRGRQVLAGDEDAARSALRIKASVRDALDNATQRAAANAALAAKLEGVIESKQLQLLQRIREARADIERRRGAEGRGAGAGGAAEEGVRELRRASSSGGRRRGGGEGGGGAQWGGS